MKTFVFPLDKVMAFRKQQWEAEAAVLESLLSNRKHLQEQRVQISTALEKAKQDLIVGGTIPSERLAEFCLGQQGSLEAINQLERALNQLRTKIEQQQRAVVSARRNYELVARLREKRLAEWQREVNREEEAAATEGFLARLTQRRFAVSSPPNPRHLAPGANDSPPVGCQTGIR
jgi:flagellar export protein FliJ